MFCVQISDVVNRLTVTLPRPRDGKVRPPSIPPSVLAARAAAAAGPLALSDDDAAYDGVEEEEEEGRGREGQDVGMYSEEERARLRTAGRKLAKEIEMLNGKCVQH